MLLDEEHRWFTVTRARDLEEANPDILDYDAITDCRMDIDESKTELMRENADGKEVSYVPPRYEYSYDFEIVISVRHPYFDEMRFRLNGSSVDFEPSAMLRPKSFNAGRPDPESCAEYRKYRQMGDEICLCLEEARRGRMTEDAESGEAPAVLQTEAAPSSGPWTCSACGGANSRGGFCEYCGSPRQ